jgi:hypothetical protein
MSARQGLGSGGQVKAVDVAYLVDEGCARDDPTDPRGLRREGANVDALPAERFLPAYSDSVWHAWRRDHRVFIDKLRLTADAIQPSVLDELIGTNKPAQLADQ